MNSMNLWNLKQALKITTVMLPCKDMLKTPFIHTVNVVFLLMKHTLARDVVSAFDHCCGASAILGTDRFWRTTMEWN